jgi:hypothetical protein
VYERHHTLRCTICQHEPDMLPLDIEQQARPASTIPWRYRYGLALLIVLVSALWFWVSLASRS